MNAMHEQRELLADTVEKVFATMPESWDPVEESGIASVLVPEQLGGFGGTWEDAFVVLFLAGFHAVPLPIADTMLGRSLLGNAGIVPPEGPLALTGAIERAGACRADAFQLAALTRAAMMAGALTAALKQSVQHANERQQFGKPIGRFQVIQHALAVLANETAAVNCAAMAACQSAGHVDASFEIAAAKLRANRGVDKATSIAHQIHGAMGFTAEHRLHHFTQRLWSWRSEYGNDRYWASYLGNIAAQRGAHELWSDLTARGDRPRAAP